jgi:hypothetical protein
LKQTLRFASPVAFRILAVVRNQSHFVDLNLMKLVFSTLLLLSNSFLQAQVNQYHDSSCLKVIQQIKSGWKLDSLGTTGFRLANAQKLIECKPGYLYPDVLLSSIGKPNEVWRTDEETSYIFYFARKSLLSGLTIYSYIRFKVTGPGNYVVQVEKGEIER